MSRSSSIGVKAHLDVSGIESGAKKASAAADKAFRSITQSAQSASYSFGLVAAGGSLISSSILNAAAVMQDLEGSFRAVTSSAAEAQKQLDFIVNFTKTTKFELKDVAEAGLKLQGLGFTASETLPSIAKLAAGMNKDLPDAAAIVGKALLGSRRSITQLRDSYGITTAELEKFGAAVDDNGLVLVKGQANIDKLRNAFQALVEKRYGRIFQEQMNNISVVLSNLKDEMFQTAAGIGKAVAPEVLTFAKVITELLHKFNELDEGTKATLGRTALFGTGIATIASAMAGLVAIVSAVGGQFIRLGAYMKNIPSLAFLFEEISATSTVASTLSGIVAGVSLSLTAMGEVASTTFGVLTGIASAAETGILAVSAAVSASFAGIVAAAAVVEVALSKLVFKAAEFNDKLLDPSGGAKPFQTLAQATDALRGLYLLNLNTLKDTTKEMEFQLKVESAILNNYQKTKGVVGQTVEDIKKRGFTELDVAAQILGLNKLKEQAEKNNNKALAETYQLQAAYLTQILPQLQGSEKQKTELQKASGKAAREASDEADKAYNQYIENRKDGIYESHAQELAALDDVVAKTKAAHTQLGTSDLNRTKDLEKHLDDLADKRVSLQRKTFKEEAEVEANSIKKKLQANEITKTQAANSFAELAVKYKSSLTLQEKFHSQSEELKRESYKDTQQAAVEAFGVEASLYEQRRLAAEKYIKLGRDINSNTEKAIQYSKEELSYELKKIEAEKNKDLGDTADPVVKETIIKRARLASTKAIEDNEQRINNIRQLGVGTLKEQLRLETEILKNKEAYKNAKIEQYQTDLERGKNVGESLKKEIKDRQKLTEQIVDAEKKARLAGEQDPKVRKNIELEFSQKAQTTKMKNAQELEKLDISLAQQQADRREKLIELAQKEAQIRKLNIEEQKKNGVDVRYQEVRLAEDLVQIEIAKIKSGVEVAKIGKDSTAQSILQRDAELQILALKKNLKKDIDEINATYKKGTDELQKQKDALKEINDELAKLKGEEKDRQEKQGGLIGGVDEFVAQNQRESRIFQLESEKRRKEGQIADKERSLKTVDLNEKEGERFGILRGGKNAAEQQAEFEREAILEDRRQKKEAEAENRRIEGRARAEEILRKAGRSEEDIQKILGVNFDQKPKTSLDQKSIDAFAKAGVKGGDEQVVNVLTAIYNLAAKAFGGTPLPGPQGTKPQNQLNNKGKSDLSSTNPYLGSSDGPYPV